MPPTRIMRNATLALLVAAALAAAPTADGSTPGIASHTVVGSTAQSKRVKDFWTAKRMRRAEPMALADAPSGPSPSSPSNVPDVGKPRTIPPSLPKGDTASGLTRRATQIINPSVFPYRTQGKLFGRDRNGTFQCSATLVNTPSKRVVFSAGHCVVENHVWATYLAFVPGYKNYNRPFGTFPVAIARVFDAWSSNQNVSYDISGLVLTKQAANIVGSRGIAWNVSASQHYVSYGYPAKYPFNGQLLWSCPSYLGGRDGSTGFPQTMWITCNMTNGSSGGGWIIQKQYLNGVNSYGYNRYPNRMYGPYFGNQARTLYNAVKYTVP